MKRYILGIDTGGTYTDGVIVSADDRVVISKVKTLTTKDDLDICISNCINSFDADILGAVSLVCLSTTLATNAIVEGYGCREGLIFVGRVPEGKLPTDNYRVIGGQIDIAGRIKEALNFDEIDEVIISFTGKADAIAISGYASVRNPIHEMYIKNRVKDLLGVPVVCAHELSASLGFYERSVTADLNARLIPLICRLIESVKNVMKRRDISAPLMIVKGDGTLMTEDLAKDKPIDTILSGPAASVIGGLYLSQERDATVLDMGGTTTDIADVTGGEIQIDNNGANVGGWLTRVRAAKIYTVDLGGDSLITIRDSSISIGPRKVIPYCMPDGFHASGERGFTPTDLLHVTGEYVRWDPERSRKAFSRLSVPAAFIRQGIEDKLCGAYRSSGANKKILVAVGAPARAWVKNVGDRLGVTVLIPEHAEVANAVGAAVGQTKESVEVLIRYDDLIKKYIIYAPSEKMEADDLDKATGMAEGAGYDLLRGHMPLGNIESKIGHEDIVFSNRYTGKDTFVERRVRITAWMKLEENIYKVSSQRIILTEGMSSKKESK